MDVRSAWLGPAGERADELASSHLPGPAAGLGFLKTESGARQLTPDCVFTDFTRLWGQLWPPHPCGLMVGDVGPRLELREFRNTSTAVSPRFQQIGGVCSYLL